MAIVIEMPKLSDTMEEGVIAKWNIKEGDTVNSGDIIAEVETDKATMDVEVFDAGTILKILAKEGDTIPLGGKMAIIGKKGENIDDLISDSDASSTDASDSQKKETAKSKELDKDSDLTLGDTKDSASPSSATSTASNDTKSDDDDRIKASPLARKMASDQGINLTKVSGSGPNGRITKADIENFDAASAKTDPATAPAMVQPTASGEAWQDVKISQMRKTIAKRLAESKFTNPHFYETIDIDMKQTIEARAKLNELSDVKISFNDLVVKASAVALSRHQTVNSSWLGDVVRRHNHIHVAVAVAVEDGLLTPVIKHTNLKGLSQISSETKILAAKARDKKLQPEEMEGSTFTISNLGMFGIEEFTAIINPPNACILAVGAIRDVPVVENGAVVPGKRMKVTLSSDHRVVDGASSAAFLQTLKHLLENPASMLL